MRRLRLLRPVVRHQGRHLVRLSLGFGTFRLSSKDDDLNGDLDLPVGSELRESWWRRDAAMAVAQNRPFPVPLILPSL
jgi:hypothetical protein